MKDHMVFAVEEENLAIGWAEFSAQSFREFYCRKSSADDDDSDCFHCMAPMAGRCLYAGSLASLAPMVQGSREREFAVLPQDAWRENPRPSNMRKIPLRRPTARVRLRPIGAGRAPGSESVHRVVPRRSNPETPHFVKQRGALQPESCGSSPWTAELPISALTGSENFLTNFVFKRRI